MLSPAPTEDRRRWIVSRRRWIVASVVAILTAALVIVVTRIGGPASAAASPGATQLVSVADPNSAHPGRQAPEGGDNPAISGNGRYVAFVTETALDNVDDANDSEGGDDDVYVRDTETGHTALISRGHDSIISIRAAAAAVPHDDPANNRSYAPSMSGDGRYVSFLTHATNIVDSSADTMLVVCDRGAPDLTRPTDPFGDGSRYVYTAISGIHAESRLLFRTPTLSADATVLAYSDLAGTPARQYVKLVTLHHDPDGAIAPPVASDVTEVHAPATLTGVKGQDAYALVDEGAQQISADGTHLVFAGQYSFFDDSDSDAIGAVFDYDVATGVVTRVDLNEQGKPVDNGGSPSTQWERQPAVSGDGRLIAFLAPVGGTPFLDATVSTVRLLDRGADFAAPIRSTVVSLGTPVPGNPDPVVSGRSPAFSADGRYLAYVTDALHVHNGVDDAHRGGSCIDWAEHDRGPTAVISNCDVVVRDLTQDRQRAAAHLPRLPAELASPSIKADCAAIAAAPGNTCEGGGDSESPVLDGDGSAVAYVSLANDLVADDKNLTSDDVFLRRFAPTLTAAPVDFGAVQVGNDVTLAVPVAHAGFGPLTITSVSKTGSGDFALLGPDTCTAATVHEGDTCLITVQFKPSAIALRAGIIDVSVRGANEPFPISVQGSGVAVPPRAPGFSATPDPIDFGVRPVTKDSPPMVVTVTNTGRGLLHVSGVSIFDGGSTGFAGDYRVTGNTCAGTAVPAGGTCQVTVVHRPLGIGVRPAALRFDDDASPSVPHLVPMTGAGAQPVIVAKPPLAQPGRVAQITGTAFPPGQTVLLTLDNMPGQTKVTTDAEGGFTKPLLILPKTYPGPRLLHATATVTATVPAPITVTAITKFLVVPGHLQPPDFTVRD